MKVKEIAELVRGEVIGDGEIEIRGIMAAPFAKEGDITFMLDPGQLEVTAESGASCVLTTIETKNFPKTVLRVKDLKTSMTVLYNAMIKIKTPKPGTIHSTAVIASTAVLGTNVSIGACAVIGGSTRIGSNTVIGANCSIGENVLIGTNSQVYPNVTLYDFSVIGNNVTIHAGVVLGADGFGYVPKDGEIFKVPQLGKVVIEDNVEIGANACIDRGTFTETVINKGTKIDNLVQIAHNVKIGKNTFVAGITGIAGSVEIGDNVMIGGHVGVADHIKIGTGAKIGGKSGIIQDVKPNSTVFGYPAGNGREMLKQFAFIKWLTGKAGKIRKLLKDMPE